MTTASSCGIAPPASEVPAPRGTTGTPCAWQIAQDRRDLLASCAGSTTASGMRR